MAIELISKIKPKNGGSFPMVDAEDVLMPDGTRLSGFNLDWDNITNKPFYYIEHNEGAAFQTPPTVFFDIEFTSAYRLYKIFNLTPSTEDLLKSSIAVSANDVSSTRTLTESEIIADYDNITGFQFGTSPYCAFAVIRTTDAFQFEFAGSTVDISAPETGFYYMHPSDNEWIEISFGIEYDELKKIDPIFLPEVSNPDNSETSSGLPEVTIDNNGNILQVVDGEWKVLPINQSAIATYVEAYISDALGGDY